MTGADRAVAAPALPLRPFVSRYAGSRMRDAPQWQHAGLPSRHIDLIVSLAGPIEIACMPGAQAAGAYRAFVAGWRDKILHATLTLHSLRWRRRSAGRIQLPQGFQIQLNIDDAVSAERIFAKLADGGRVTVSLQQTFWAQQYGEVVDRFNIPWIVNCGERQVE